MLKNTDKIRLAVGMLTIGALIAVLIPTHYHVHAGEPECSASMIAGTYAFALDGLVSLSSTGNPQLIKNFYPLAAVGTFSFDGAETSSRSYTVSFAGQISENRDSGPYHVNSDCTGRATYSDGTWHFVIVRDGREIKAMNASPGVVVQGVLTRQ
jgi:uncharacterized protein (UPF0333 family)